jgi:acyl-CoA hydrolase
MRALVRRGRFLAMAHEIKHAGPHLPGRKVEMPPPESLKDGKPVSASRSEITEIVLPNDANLLGNMLGGRVMHLIDIAGALAATRHANLPVVTASVDYLDFRFPIHLGEWIVLKSQVNRVFNTSMEVGVKVYAENVLTGERRHTSSAYLTFVAVDMDQKAHPVRPLILETPEDKRRYEDAGERRRVRLNMRNKKPLDD